MSPEVEEFFNVLCPSLANHHVVLAYRVHPVRVFDNCVCLCDESDVCVNADSCFKIVTLVLCNRSSRYFVITFILNDATFPLRVDFCFPKDMSTCCY